MKNRRKARELALQILYQMDIRRLSSEEALKIIFSRYRFKPEVKNFSENLVRGVYSSLHLINELIKKYAKNWTLERMVIIDRNVLRLSIYELFFLKDIPSIVSINEAIEIAKRYGTKDSGKFVNGILDKIRKERGIDSPLKWNFLEESLQKNPYLQKLIKLKKKEKLWLVGGYIRNLLIGKKSKDLDFIIEDPHFRLARRFASEIKANIVSLNPSSMRVILKEKVIFDFALKKSSSIKSDLIKRDFTINALALELGISHPVPLILIDPDTGLEDLIEKRIKLINKESLDEDPLRMMRAFRLASQLNLTIEKELLSIIREKSPLLKKIPGERIRDELFLILKNICSSKYLKNPSLRSLLKEVFNIPPQGRNLKRLETILSPGILSEDIYKKVTLHLNKKEGGDRTRRELLKLTSLFFSPLKKVPILAPVAERLKLTNREIKIVKRIEQLYPFLHQIMNNHPSSQSLSRLFLEGKEETVEILLLFLVNTFNEENLSKSIDSLLKKFFEKSPLIFCPPKLLKGEEITKLLGIPPGPKISYFLDKIHQAQIIGEVKTKEDAILLIKGLCHQKS